MGWSLKTCSTVIIFISDYYPDVLQVCPEKDNSTFTTINGILNLKKVKHMYAIVFRLRLSLSDISERDN